MRRSILSSLFSAGEVLSEEHSLKKTRFKGEKKVLIWAEISYTGARCLYFIEGNENTDVYEQILDDCLPDIKEIWYVARLHFLVRQRNSPMPLWHAEGTSRKNKLELSIGHPKAQI